jgi:transcriptional regulator with XRE-family HTH domain
MENQFKGYDNTFSITLRSIMESHPNSGEKTTQKALGEAIGVRPQTISLYMDGSTQPTADNLYKIAKYFNVSVDYLLTGVSSENKDLHKQLGLSEDAVNWIKRAHDTGRFDNCTDVITTLNSLLSDRYFYAFLKDLTFKAESLKALMNQTEEEKRNRPRGINIEGYYIWDLQMYVQSFIHKELVKRGLQIEEE